MSVPTKSDGTPIQASTVCNPAHYKTTQRMAYPLRGVILSVRQADHPQNRSARERTDHRGFIAEATVWVADATGGGGLLENVFIPPSAPSGLDNFYEMLPRGSSKTCDGLSAAEVGAASPHELDGDWCIVSFLNGDLQSPYISSWWSHPRNFFDPSTSENGGTVKYLLNQSGRYFRRINGMECVVTKEGNIWISTSRSGTRIEHSSKSIDGRYPRNSTLGPGGSILVNVNPTQTFQISFDPQVDGVGAGGAADASLPQRNVKGLNPTKPPSAATNITASATSITFEVPLVINIRSEAAVVVNAPAITLGDNATDLVALSTPTNANSTALKVALNTACLAVINASPPLTTPLLAFTAFQLALNTALATWPLPVAATKVRAE